MKNFHLIKIFYFWHGFHTIQNCSEHVYEVYIDKNFCHEVSPFFMVLCSYISCLYTMFMESGILPTAWKVGYVFKKGASQLPSNYRPVSMTSICCKVMESIVSESGSFPQS